MRYDVTQRFIGGILDGITITTAWNFAPQVGKVVERPIGGSAYVIVSVVKVG